MATGSRTGLQWEPDVLGEGFEKLDLPLGHDEEGPVHATLVRFRPSTVGAGSAGQTPANVVLYIHGWNDYFLHTELARFWAELGVACYAVDLRKHGRSLRKHHTPGYITSLDDYDADLDAAITALTADQSRRNAAGPRIHLMGHSTGGLVSALWADRHPGRIHSLILNSPWLEQHGSSLVRNAAASLVEPLARMRPQARLKLPEFGSYWRSLSNQADGEWELIQDWRWEFGFPVRAGWVRAVIAGQARVALGLNIDVPVLVMLSDRSLATPVWTEEAKRSDIVLDVKQVARRAHGLGPRVTINRVEGAMHDVLLSAGPVRAGAYADLRQWARAYVLADWP
ncbi:alpha/beta hydrolase [Arthrobacter castelli]|uniref:alpha/beta hydrolase n=1 Tax=Arthrobacter castelli TaxID=271431 RepID=UPI00055E6E74|nr:alpha/beta hydrolase [Arthrobacter castelli]